MHPLIQDRFLSSGKDTTGFYVPRNKITQYHKTLFKQKYFGIIVLHYSVTLKSYSLTTVS